MDLKTIIRQMHQLGVADPLLRGIGLEYRRSAFTRFFAGLGVFSAGILIGAGIGMIFAPMRGDELREKARSNIDTWRSRMAARGAEVASGVSERAERARAQAESMAPAGP